MKRLIFKLISNKDIIIDRELNYILKDNIIKFKIDDTLYEYDITNNIFSKKDKDSLITINFKDKNMKIKLHEIDNDFYMDIIDVDIKNNKSKIELTYTFINDEKTTNCIIIEYQ